MDVVNFGFLRGWDMHHDLGKMVSVRKFVLLVSRIISLQMICNSVGYHIILPVFVKILVLLGHYLSDFCYLVTVNGLYLRRCVKA